MFFGGIFEIYLKTVQCINVRNFRMEHAHHILYLVKLHAACTVSFLPYNSTYRRTCFHYLILLLLLKMLQLNLIQFIPPENWYSMCIFLVGNEIYSDGLRFLCIGHIEFYIRWFDAIQANNFSFILRSQRRVIRPYFRHVWMYSKDECAGIISHTKRVPHVNWKCVRVCSFSI